MMPKYEDIEIPLLAELQRRGGRSRPKQRDEHGHTVYDALAQYFGLTGADLSEKVYESDGTARSKWENMVRWARNELRKKRLLIAGGYGVWAVGERGLAFLEARRSRLRRPYGNT